MKDQKVFVLGLGFNGSQEKQLVGLREKFCSSSGWERGLILPPLIVIRVMNTLLTKEQLSRLTANSGGSVALESLDLYSSPTREWKSIGASLSQDTSWENFDQILRDFPDSGSSETLGPWNQLSSFFGYPFLCLGFGRFDGKGPNKVEARQQIKLTRPLLRIYQVHTWELTGSLWFENLEWTLGFERRLRLPKF